VLICQGLDALDHGLDIDLGLGSGSGSGRERARERERSKPPERPGCEP
jgi:hypothetical protein